MIDSWMVLWIVVGFAVCVCVGVFILALIDTLYYKRYVELMEKKTQTEAKNSKLKPKPEHTSSGKLVL